MNDYRKRVRERDRSEDALKEKNRLNELLMDSLPHFCNAQSAKTELFWLPIVLHVKPEPKSGDTAGAISDRAPSFQMRIENTTMHTRRFR